MFDVDVVDSQGIIVAFRGRALYDRGELTEIRGRFPRQKGTRITLRTLLETVPR